MKGTAEVKMTSAQWIKEERYNKYKILDYTGWPKERFNYHWYNEPIDEKEFQIRLSYSAVRNTENVEDSWTHPWSNVVIIGGREFFKGLSA